jgi:hypothetical protein
MDNINTSKLSGTFVISPNRSIHGELTLSGRNILLYLRDEQEFNVSKIADGYILGTLHNLQQISLIDCISPGLGIAGTESGQYHFANFRAHYAVLGSRHLKPTEKIITQIAFVMDDTDKLFCDFDAFGIVLNTKQFIQQLVLDNADAFGRVIATGPEPLICYFSGKKEIITIKTNIGRISVSHNPNVNLGGPNGVRINNRIFVSIDFIEPLAFHEAIMSTIAPLQFFAIVVGRIQNLSNISILTDASDQRSCVLEVNWSQAPGREPSDDGEKPSAVDVLMDAVQDPAEFSRILANWLDRHQTWRHARHRFASSFVKQSEFTLDRLIGAANMFDILPSSAVPSPVRLPQALKAAKDECVGIFEALPPSPEQQSVLSALGRVGRANLKQKIGHRAGLLLPIADRFPDLTWVINEAVNCRNYYVHGGKPRFNYDQLFSSVVFFTRTLEFVFVASDLIEAGWNAKAWSERPTVYSHFCSRYLIDYKAELEKLKAFMPTREG